MWEKTELPALDRDAIFITDGGFETSLIFHQGLDLPSFAAFDLLKNDAGVQAIRDYFAPYVELAREHRVGLVLDTATWRANPDWGATLDYSPEALDAANTKAVELAREIGKDAQAASTPVVVNGVVGPRGDGYVASDLMTAEEAQDYHSRQIGTFARAGAEMITAVTMTYSAEAVGIVRAAVAARLPVVISFTVETDGRLPSGENLGDAIELVDAETAAAPIYYMINCAHPTHFEAVLRDGGAWLDRIGGLRANASKMSHAELDEAEELDDGDPVELGAEHRALRDLLPRTRVLGGCCGTDSRHVGAVCAAWLD